MTHFAIVDDDANLRESIVKYLEATRRFRCVSCLGSGEQAIGDLPAKQPKVVLMDINLGGMSGIECVRKLKALLPDAHFLMLTVFEDTDKIFNALAAGASGYLLKRQPPKKLREALEEVLSGGAPMSAPIACKVVASFQKQPAALSETGQLSQREKEVLECLAKGFAYKQIADQLNISLDTIRTYIKRIYEKLHVQDKGQAIAKFLNH